MPKLKLTADPLYSLEPSSESCCTMRAKYTYLRLVTHFIFLIKGPDQKMVTKRPYNWSPGLILCAICTICQPDPLERVTGLSSAGNRPKTKYKLYFFITSPKRR